MAKENIKGAREMLLVSDFDQTLSFNDSGIVLSEMLGIPGFEERVAGLAKIHLIQQGGELPYLLLHDPEFRRVRKEDLAAVGKRVRLKKNIGLLLKFLGLLDEYRFSFHVVSAAPEEVIQSALEGIVPVEDIHGTQFPLRRSYWRDSIDCPGPGRLRKSSGGRGLANKVGARPRPHRVRGRRKLGRQRDAPRQPA